MLKILFIIISIIIVTTFLGLIYSFTKYFFNGNDETQDKNMPKIFKIINSSIWGRGIIYLIVICYHIYVIYKIYTRN